MMNSTPFNSEVIAFVDLLKVWRRVFYVDCIVGANQAEGKEKYMSAMSTRGSILFSHSIKSNRN